MANKVLVLLQLIVQFYETEIVGAIELLTWLAIQKSDFYQMLWQTDYVRPTMAVGLILIPVLTALVEYRSKREEITRLVGLLR